MIISFLFSLITEMVLVIHFFFLFENRLRFFLAFNPVTSTDYGCFFILFLFFLKRSGF